MIKRIRISATGTFIAMFVLIGAGSLLAGCNTTEGLGQDVSNTGRVISNTANDAKPR